MVRRQPFISWVTLLALLLSSIGLGASFIGSAATARAASAPTITEFPTSGSVDGITSGPEGDLWFTDLQADKIGSITPTGSINEYPLSYPLLLPGGITTGPDGNLWFTDHAANRIGVMSPGGTVITSYLLNYVNGNQSGLTSIVTGPDGNLWFTEDVANMIGRITPSGAFTLYPVPSGKEPERIAAGPDGNLWFTDGKDSIGRIAPNGTISEFFISVDAELTGVTTGPDGNIWFSEYTGGIGHISPEGTNVKVYTVPGVFVAPEDITTGADGNLWFTDALANSVGSVTPGGQITEYGVPTVANAVKYIVSGPDHNIWFTEANKIGKVTLTATTPITTPTVPATTTACPQECLQAAYAAYGLDVNQFGAPTSMDELERDIKANDGFASVAVKDSHGNIIIANEGANIASPLGKATTYQNWSAVADSEILLGSPPKALADAIAFAKKVIADHPGSKIYVTGHDLGGVEAEAQAAALPTAIAGGATFGASGLPNNTTAGTPATFINYVDYGDAIGNYASDNTSLLHTLAPVHMDHYGVVQLVGASANAADLQDAVSLKKNLSSLPVKIIDAVGYIYAPVKTFGTAYKGTLYAFTGVYLGLATHLYHPLAHYATDLGISLTQKGTVAPPISMDEFLKIYDPNASKTDLKNDDAAKVSQNGTLVAPDEKISFAPTGATVTAETYDAPDGSVYNTTLNSGGAITVVLVNETNKGGSFQIRYDTSNSQPWSSAANFYSAANAHGKLTKTIYNWKTGGSQVLLFTGLPKGVTEQVLNYSGPDGTGKLISKQNK